MKHTDMNALLRQAVRGFTEEEWEEHLARRERQRKHTPMNTLLRMARGVVVEQTTEGEGDD